MKIERDETQGRNAFTGYGEGYVEVGGKRFTSSLVVSGDRIVTDWPAASVESLAPDHLAAEAARSWFRDLDAEISGHTEQGEETGEGRGGGA